MAAGPNEPQDRRNVGLIVLVILALLFSSTATVLVAANSKSHTSLADSAAGRTGAGLGSAKGGVDASGKARPVDDEQTFATTVHAAPDEGGEDAGTDEMPERLGDHDAPDAVPPPDGATADPNEDKTSPASGGGLPQVDEPDDEPLAEVANGGYEPVIVAIADDCFDPYHYDFLSSKMPQHMDTDPSNDLPLTTDPSTWIPGFPSPSTFSSYGALTLTLPSTATTSPDTLHGTDSAAWSAVPQSFPGDIHLRWIPGTKVVGFVNMGSYMGASCSDGYGSTTPCGGACHGSGTTSAAVGNLYGSCPECLFVFVNGFGEEGAAWIESQDWIDVQSESWGYGIGRCDPVIGLCAQATINSVADLSLQRSAIQRGQAAFFSSGNGMLDDFSVMNTALTSSHSGPDWVVTVGAVNPDGDAFVGAGKPVDVASLGDEYPTSYGATTVTGEGLFGGTSNATPVTAGIYAHALYDLRKAMAGPSRIQAGGKVSVGALPCGSANPGCPTADGVVTVHELERALYEAAAPSGGGTAVGTSLIGLYAPVPSNPADNEDVLMSQGHGTFFGRLNGDAPLYAEVKAVVDVAKGATAPTMDAVEVEWFTHDSECRQELWGNWDYGFWLPTDPVPTSDPTMPVQTAVLDNCAMTWGSAMVI